MIVLYLFFILDDLQPFSHFPLMKYHPIYRNTFSLTLLERGYCLGRRGYQILVLSPPSLPPNVQH